MKFTVTQENLNQALNNVSRVASTKTSTLPILSNILISADKNSIKFSSTNLEIAINQSIGGKVTSAGETTVPAKLISEFVSNLPKGNINFDLEINTLKISTNSYKSNINCVSVEEFPSLPTINKNKTQSIKNEVLQNALNQVVFTASKDESRQVLTGVLLKPNSNKTTLVATDSYRLAEKTINTLIVGESVLIPATALNDLLRIIQNTTEDIKVYTDESQVMFEVDGVELISRIVDGEYPEYEQLIPNTGGVNIEVDKSEFINITKVSSLFARESAGSITLHVSEADQEISIKSIASQVGDNTSIAKAKIKGEGEITLNSRFLLEALNAVEGETIQAYFSGKINPFVVTSNKHKDYRHIVMPLRS